MNPVNKHAIYISHPEVAWFVEKTGIHLIRRDTGDSKLILYPEAMLWDLLTRNKSYRRLVNLVAAVAGLRKETAEHFIRKKIEDWVQERWLVVKVRDG